MLSWDSIELGLEHCLKLVRADRRVLAEFERSRDEFFTDPAVARAPLAELRHLEWFLLERPSPALGSTPALAWQADWRASSPAAEAELSAGFLQSIPGAFEVTSLVRADGLWVRDLFTLGVHPVAETRATAAIEVGDLLVGRLFPAGGGIYLLSSSVSVFRNPTLVTAVQRDLAEMRAVRRGVLRVQQLELERLFHGPGARTEVTQPIVEVRARARAELRAQGLEARIVEELLERVLDAARTSQGQVITDILSDLAFETGVDLPPVRLVLVELWHCERHVQGNRPIPVPEDVPIGEPSARAALEAFDRGRAQGHDLEQLFRDMERDLGLDDASDEVDPSPEEEGLGELSGVIGSVVEEFLWEVEREQGPEKVRAWGVLRTLGDYARDISVFEELGQARLLDFSTRWVLDESGMSSAAEVEALMDALAAFCQWCEERHDLPLWRQFGGILGSLRVSVPRHVVLRQVKTTGSGSGAYRVVQVGVGEALVRDEVGCEQAIAINAHQAAHLRSGDLVRLSLRKGLPALAATYPSEVAAFLSR